MKQFNFIGVFEFQKITEKKDFEVVNNYQSVKGW